MRHPNKKNMANLYVVSNEGLVYNFPIVKDIVTIGRSRDNDVVLRENTVSRMKGEFKIRRVGPRRVKGKRAAITVYEVS